MNVNELSSLLRESVTGLNKRLRKQSPAAKSYSMTEIETILYVSRNEQLLPSELATLTRIKPQSMSQILKKLEDQSVIKRTFSKDDKRKVYISLTATGKKVLEQTRHTLDEWLKNAIEEKLSEKEKDVLVKAIPILNKLIEIKI